MMTGVVDKCICGAGLFALSHKAGCPLRQDTETPPIGLDGGPALTGVTPAAAVADNDPSIVTQRLVKALLPVGAFRTDDHRYYFNGEGPYPSVTTILEVLSKPALVQWKAKEAARAIIRASAPEHTGKTEEELILWALAEADKQRDTAAKLGTGLHHLADMAARAPEARSETFQVTEQEKPYLEAWRGFLDRYGASSIISSEHMVWSLNGYGGTYDLIMQLPKLGLDERSQGETELWLIDIKTSKGIYPEYGLQLAAYRWADSIIVPNVPTPYPMPMIHKTGVLHLRPDQYPDTGWRLIEYPTDYQKDYLTFLGALEIWRWRKEGRFTKSRLNLHKP